MKPRHLPALAFALGLSSLGAGRLARIAHAAEGQGPHATDAARETPSSQASPLGRAQRLAEQLQDEEALWQIAVHKAEDPHASCELLENLARASEVLGAPDRAMALLAQRVAEGRDPETALAVLAPLYDRAGRPAAAHDAWAKLLAVRGLRGLTVDESLAWARSLVRLDRVEEALAALRAVSSPPPLARQDYWDALAELAWQTGDDATLGRACEAQWGGGNRTPEVARRLFALAKDRGDVRRMRSLAEENVTTNGRTELFLDAASTLVDQARWDELEAMLGWARGRQALFASDASFWSLESRRLAHRGQTVAAVAAAEKAAKLAPRSVVLVGELLWRALEAGDAPALERAIKLATAAGQERLPVIAEPLGLGLIVLGRPMEALALWNEPALATDMAGKAPDALAEALEAGGRIDLAARARALADRALLGAPPAGDGGEGADTEAALRFGEVLGRRRGIEAEVRWLRAWRAAAAPPATSAQRRARRAFDATLAEMEGRPEVALALWQQLDQGGRDETSRDPASDEEGASDDDPAPEPRGLGKDERARLLDLALAEGDLAVLRRELDRAAATPAPAIAPKVPAPRTRVSVDDTSTPALVEAALALHETGRARTLWMTAPATDETVAQGLRIEEREEQEATHARAGGTWDTVGDVSAVGPDGELLVPDGRWAWRGSAAARWLALPGLAGGPSPELHEGLVLVGLNRLTSRSSLNVAVGATAHTAGALPRATAAYELRLERWAFLAAHADLAAEADDAPLLRALAAKSFAEIALRVQSDLFYASLQGGVREDRTRQASYLGHELDQDAEVGVRVLREGPTVEAGLRLHVQQRWNTARMPGELARYWAAAPLATSDLPGSYTYVSGVLRAVEGDINVRPDTARQLRPHYECFFEGGLRFPDREWATGASCSAAVRFGHAGFLSASAAYGWGLLGISRVSSTHVALAYTLLL